MIQADYISHMGSDMTICDAARVSFNKEASNYTDEQNHKLIAYLAKHQHTTPFTHPQITLRETVPIFVARQRFKHVVGFSYNEVSRRYVSDVPEFFTPKAWREKPQGSVKQGSGDEHAKSNYYTHAYHLLLQDALALYDDMIKTGVAPELARMVLPQSMMTSYYVTGSLAAFARMYNQRSDSHAQKEVQLLAAEVGEIIAPLFPVAWAALTKGSY